MRRALLGAAMAVVAAAAMLGAGCGDNQTDASGNGQGIDPPRTVRLPQPSNRSMRALIQNFPQGPELAPSVFVLEPGRNRLGFALFDRGNRQIGGLEVGLYVARGLDETAKGPYYARYHRIEVKPQYQSRNTAEDPDSAKSIYVAETSFPRAGNYVVAAVTKLNGRLVAALTQVMVDRDSKVPGPGDRAIKVHTPTLASVGGNAEKIDTRIPPDDMHDVDLADALDRHRPTVLLFATPALCQSKICGPVTDVTEQVKSEFGDKADFIHMEIYNDNDLNKGPRPQFTAWHLNKEPVLFTINRDGRIVDRIQGAFSADELSASVRKAIR